MASGIINISKPADLFEGWFGERRVVSCEGPGLFLLKSRYRKEVIRHRLPQANSPTAIPGR